MTIKIFLLESKLSIEKVESVAEIMQLKKEAFSLVKSYIHADYIVTELKSRSRIVRNTPKATCPVVHMDWLTESLALHEILLDPTPYIMDISKERARMASNAMLPLPNQVTWSQLAEAHQANHSKHMDDHRMIYKERQSYFSHKGRKSIYRNNKRKKRYNQR